MAPMGKVVPIILLVSFLCTIGVIYGGLEMSDKERTAFDIFRDLMSGKLSLKDIWNDTDTTCSGDDVNGVYELDADKNCIFKGCKMGYLPQGDGCVEWANFTGTQAIDCEISGYTYSECKPKVNQKCGEGAGTREKYPTIIKGAIGGTCESFTFEDCDIDCPNTCSVNPEDYSIIDGADCIGVKTNGDQEILGRASGYCGSGREQLQLINANITLEDAIEAGFSTVQEYLEYANPGGVCAASMPTACNVSCNQVALNGDPMQGIGCNYTTSEYAYISDKSGQAICFTQQSVNEYLNPTPGQQVSKPIPLNTIEASEVRLEDGTYDMNLISDDRKIGVHLLYRAGNNMSYEDLVKENCHLYKTEPCNALKESVNCVINETHSGCKFVGCDQIGIDTITRQIETHPFGEGETCIQRYTDTTTTTTNDGCSKELRCCEDDDYEPVEGTCSTDGFQKYTLNPQYCEKTDRFGNVSPEEVTRACDVDCVQDDWVDEGTCDSLTGRIRQNRNITTAAQNSGTACGPWTQYIDCDVDCVQDDWTNSGTCNSSTGKQSQTRTTITAAQNSGTACGIDTQEVDCDVNAVCGWADSGTCSTDGFQTQTRTTITSAINSGTTCGIDTQEVDCDVNAVCGWADSGTCNSSTGKQSQTRTTITSAINSGTTCGIDTQEVDCDVNAVCGWADSGTCNSSTGKQSQTRTTITSAINSGTTCGPLTQEVDCDVDCVGDWSGTWGECSRTCGGGTQTQTWDVSTAAINNGTCDNKGDIKSQSCNNLSCCSTSLVGEWEEVGGYEGCVQDVDGEYRRKYTRTGNGTLCSESNEKLDELCHYDCRIESIDLEDYAGTTLNDRNNQYTFLSTGYRCASRYRYFSKTATGDFRDPKGTGKACPDLTPSGSTGKYPVNFFRNTADVNTALDGTEKAPDFEVPDFQCEIFEKKNNSTTLSFTPSTNCAGVMPDFYCGSSTPAWTHPDTGTGFPGGGGGNGGIDTGVGRSR